MGGDRGTKALVGIIAAVAIGTALAVAQSLFAPVAFALFVVAVVLVVLGLLEVDAFQGQLRRLRRADTGAFMLRAGGEIAACANHPSSRWFADLLSGRAPDEAPGPEPAGSEPV